MSKCGRNRWGPGTTCEKPTNTEAAKELEERISAMTKERAKQDQMWTVQEEKAKPETKDQTGLRKQ
jgi:hypothetical protein